MRVVIVFVDIVMIVEFVRNVLNEFFLNRLV